MDKSISFHLLVCLSILSAVHITPGDSQLNSKSDLNILDHLLTPERYDRRLRPMDKVGENPVVVIVHGTIHDIEIDDLNMENRFQLTLDQSWNDQRMEFNESMKGPAYLTAVFDDKIKLWTPGLNFINVIDSKQILLSSNCRIFSNGSISCSTRLSLRLSCPMHFHYFPFDSQLCYMVIYSGVYTTDQLVLKWKNDSLQVNNGLRIKNYLLLAFGTSHCSIKSDGGEFGCLKAGFLFKRLNHYHLMRIFFPCCVAVIISWLTFFLNSKQQIALRLSLALMTVLITSIQVSTYYGTVVSAGYLKLVDVWTGACLALSFSALVQSIVIHNLMQKGDKPNVQSENGKREPELISSNRLGGVERNYEEIDSAIPVRNCNRLSWSKIMSVVCSPDGINFASIIIYPILFMSMLICFWISISHSSNSVEDEFSKSVDKHISFVVDEKLDY